MDLPESRKQFLIGFTFLVLVVFVFLMGVFYIVPQITVPVGFYKGNTAQVDVSSAPSGAWVFLDGMGNQKGRTPNSFEVSPGTHTLIVRSPDFGKWTKEFTASPGETLKIHADLSTLEGVTTTTTSPPKTTTITKPTTTTLKKPLPNRVAPREVTEGLIEEARKKDEELDEEVDLKDFNDDPLGGGGRLLGREPDFDGYIIEFTSPALLEKRNELLNEISRYKTEAEELSAEDDEGPKADRASRLLGRARELELNLPSTLALHAETVASGWTVSAGEQWVEKTFTETPRRFVRLDMTSCNRPYCNLREYEVKTRTYG